MEYVMYILIIIVCGMVLYDRLTIRNKEVSENPTPVTYETQVIQFPDEVLTLPTGMKVYEVPDISTWTPPMKEIFHLTTKDRKSWVWSEFEYGFGDGYTHKTFNYKIQSATVTYYRGMIECVERVRKLHTLGVLDMWEENAVIRLAEIYFKVKYHERLNRLERLKQYKGKKLIAEQEQQRLLTKQQEADKINEYLATLKKG